MICELLPLRREEKRDEAREMELARGYARKVMDMQYDLKTNAEAYKKIFNWIAQYNLSQANKEFTPPARGLLLVGAPGRGKTVAARFISHFCQIHFWTMKWIDEKWGIDPEECKQYFDDVFRDLKVPTIIDDLGSETMTKHYNMAPVFEFLLPFMYDRWTTYQKLFIVTTNLAMNGTDAQTTIAGAYGPRIKSRFDEMFDVVLFQGNDMRRGQ